MRERRGKSEAREGKLAIEYNTKRRSINLIFSRVVEGMWWMDLSIQQYILQVCTVGVFTLLVSLIFLHKL